MHIEGLRDVPRFAKAALRAIQKGISLVALKSGASTIGPTLTVSHTGSRSDTDDLCEGLFARVGVIRVKSSSHLLATLKFLIVAEVSKGSRVFGFTCSLAALPPADRVSRRGGGYPATCAGPCQFGTGLCRAIRHIGRDRDQSAVRLHQWHLGRGRAGAMHGGMTMLQSHPNPDLTVGADNKQGWNQPTGRRHGFHNAHLLLRRTMTVRARRVLDLVATADVDLTARVRASGLTALAPFSALVVAQGNSLLYDAAATDFATTRPHSVQSISKMHIHLIIGELLAAGRLTLTDKIAQLLPWIGSAYAGATLQDVLDMNVENNYSEDYADPFAGCYREEEAIGFRLPPNDGAEPTLRDFVGALTGGDLVNRSGYAQYKSANTDLLTVLAAGFVNLPGRMEAIADAAGYAGAIHMSLSPDLLPAFSGGGCLSAQDLARFGLLLARGGEAVFGTQVGSTHFTQAALSRQTLRLGPKRGAVRYANHVMTNGRWIGHGGYGGQFLMVDMQTGRVAVFLSVLENASGYDTDYMADVVARLEQIICT